MLVPSQPPTSQRWLRDKGHHFDFGVHLVDISTFWLCVLTGKPPSVNAWLAQCCLYVLLMVIVKICITVLIQFDFWDDVRDFILSPVTNPKVEVVVVMLIIPFFINVSIGTDIMMHCLSDCWRYVQWNSTYLDCGYPDQLGCLAKHFLTVTVLCLLVA